MKLLFLEASSISQWSQCTILFLQHLQVESVYQCCLEWLTGVVPASDDMAATDPPPFSPAPASEGELRERLAGLYLMWTVFCAQPYQPKVLVRMEDLCVHVQ